MEIICRFCSSFLLQNGTVLGMWTEVKSDCVYMCVGSQPVVWYIQKHILPMLVLPLLSVQALPLGQSLFRGERGDLGSLRLAVIAAEELRYFSIVLLDFSQGFLDVLQRFLLIGFVDSASLIFTSTVMLDLFAVIFDLLQPESR